MQANYSQDHHWSPSLTPANPQWSHHWRPASEPPVSAQTSLHPALATPPFSLAGEKRKLSNPDLDDSSSTSLHYSSLDALRKRQRRFRSHSSLSDSDDADEGPRTPASNSLDDGMDWAAEPAPTIVAPNQPFTSPPWRDASPSPSNAIHRLELLREARPPVIATYSSSFNRSPYARQPPPSKALPMTLQTFDNEYVFRVELPGYNIDGITVSCKRGNVVTVVADIWHLPRECCHTWDITFDDDVRTEELRATMDRSTNVLTLVARRYRRRIPIEYQVDKSVLRSGLSLP